MDSSLRDILLEHIDAALDVDDLENIGDYVRSILTTAAIDEWHMAGSLKNLHTDLVQEMNGEKSPVRKIRLRAALSYFEADFTEFLIAIEVETLPNKN